jgi:cell division protein FtsB
MSDRRIYAIAGLAVLIGSPSMAQDTERYQIERTEDGYVRLDTTTGKMTLCRERAEQLVCTVAAEERAAYDRDIDALQDRVDTLEDRISALEDGRSAADLPDDQEFERTMGYMEKFMRRFMGIAKDLERDFGTEPAEPQADRT